jgi:hypothetical protein
MCHFSVIRPAVWLVEIWRNGRLSPFSRPSSAHVQPSTWQRQAPSMAPDLVRDQRDFVGIPAFVVFHRPRSL